MASNNTEEDMKRVITTNYEAVEEDDRGLNGRQVVRQSLKRQKVSWKLEDACKNNREMIQCIA